MSLTEAMLASPWLPIIGVLVAVVAYFASIRCRSGLRRIPGPFWASVLPLDRLLTAKSAQQQKFHLDYHKRYGPLVRVGPNHVSFNDPALSNEIYAIHTKFEKSNFYKVFDVDTEKGRISTTFSIRNEAQHSALRRPVGAAFALSAILEYEPLADSATTMFMEKLDKYQGTNFDLGKWLHWYAFDVVSAVTFSNQLGFMEQGEDIQGMIQAIDGRQEYSSLVAMTPSVEKLLLGNRFMSHLLSFLPWFANINKGKYIGNFAREQLELRKEAGIELEKRDLLSRFKRVRGKDQVMTDSELRGHAQTTINAGSDTTAITLRSIIYYVCKNPQIHARLTEEILAADAAGELSDHVTWQEAQKLEYFQACIKEALRIHPPVGQILERLVPAGGAVVHGIHLPAGTIIGANAWTIARNESIYGRDVDQFRPERWLDADEATLKYMEKSSLAFGGGSRTCVGKHIALMEVSKLIPQLFRHYEIRLSDPTAEWETRNYFFVRQLGLTCVFTRRNRSALADKGNLST